MKYMVLLVEILLAVMLFAMPSFPAERPQSVQSKFTPPVAGPAILSIIPAQAEPGSRVMLFGSGFGDMASVFLGSVEIPAATADGKQVEFTVPDQLEPGLYALYLKRSDGIVSRPCTFTDEYPQNGSSPHISAPVRSRFFDGRS